MMKQGSLLGLYAPLLVLYLLIIGFMFDPNWTGDEIRFRYYAENLTHGYFGDPVNPDFRNGPGYSLFLTPFVALGLPKLSAVLANAFLILGGLFFFQKAARLLVSEKWAHYLTLILGLYPVLLKAMPKAVYEGFYFFLVCGFLYYFLRAMLRPKLVYKDFIIAGLFVGVLALTRFMYGYALFVSLPLLFLASVIWRKATFKAWGTTVAVGIMICLPYLAYTYSVTGKVFYWGTNGGEVLYWMTTAEPNEYGDWQAKDKVLLEEIEGMSPIHKEFILKIMPLNHIQRDDALKARAMENMSAHPEIYVKNWVANVVRMFWGFPRSYRQQDLRPVPYIILNSLLLIALAFSIVAAYRNYRSIPLGMWALWCVFLIYVGLTSLVHAEPRYLVSAVPFLLLWIAYVANSYMKFRIL
ncbi:MAG: ArnT family glycosyltransferase [Bacteroidia bacterium]